MSDRTIRNSGIPEPHGFSSLSGLGNLNIGAHMPSHVIIPARPIRIMYSHHVAHYDSN